MTKEKLRAAKAEMRRLLLCIEHLEAARHRDDNQSHPRRTGAVRRASLDLTRALADLRKPG